MEGRLTRFIPHRGGTQSITVTVTADFSDTYDELKDGPVEITIKKAHKHRSMEANRYAWALIGQIAAKKRIKKSEVYRHAILDIGGVSKEMYMKAEAVPVFREIWEKQGLGNQVEIVDEDAEGWCSLHIYFGSSTYDTAQMSALLDSLIQDAEALGIPTITPKEEERMLQQWGRKRKGANEDGTRDQNGAGDAGKGDTLPEAERGQLPEDQPDEGGAVRGRDESREMAAQR